MRRARRLRADDRADGVRLRSSRSPAPRWPARSSASSSRSSSPSARVSCSASSTSTRRIRGRGSRSSPSSPPRWSCSRVPFVGKRRARGSSSSRRCTPPPPPSAGRQPPEPAHFGADVQRSAPQWAHKHTPGDPEAIAARLRQLDQLKESGLLDDAAYAEQPQAHPGGALVMRALTVFFALLATLAGAYAGFYVMRELGPDDLSGQFGSRRRGRPRRGRHPPAVGELRPREGGARARARRRRPDQQLSVEPLQASPPARSTAAWSASRWTRPGVPRKRTVGEGTESGTMPVAKLDPKAIDRITRPR